MVLRLDLPGRCEFYSCGQHMELNVFGRSCRSFLPGFANTAAWEEWFKCTFLPYSRHRRMHLQHCNEGLPASQPHCGSAAERNRILLDLLHLHLAEKSLVQESCACRAALEEGLWTAAITQVTGNQAVNTNIHRESERIEQTRIITHKHKHASTQQNSDRDARGHHK